MLGLHLPRDLERIGSIASVRITVCFGVCLSGGLALCPPGLPEVGSCCALDPVSGWASDSSFFPRTALLFSVLRGFANASTSACNAVEIFS